MKRLFFSIIFFILALFAYTQNFNGGLKGGFAASQISGDELSGFNKVGPVFGGWVNYYFGRSDALELEVYYTQKGSKKNPSDNDFQEYTLRLHYLEVPALYRHHFSSFFSVEVGPSFAVLVDYVEKNQDGEAAFAIYDDFDRIDLSVNLGLNFDIADKWAFNIRFNNSVLPVREHTSGATYRLNRGQYNSVIVNALHLKL